MIMREIGMAPVVIGGGLAGLLTALHLAPLPVILLADSLAAGASASTLAQGGIAAAIGPDDSASLHIADTIAAGDGLCDPETVERIITAGPAAIETLLHLGAGFDRTSLGTLALGLEAAHSRRRIAHCRGDGTGQEIMRAVVAAVRATPSISVLPASALSLIVEEARISGVVCASASGPFLLPTARVIIATGGIGGLFLDTTNPRRNWGHGLALAARAGATLADMEFVQFHPTALDAGQDPLSLVSEAVRGEGAVLVNETGAPVMASVPGRDLAPRDHVSREIARQMAAGHRVFLDARQSSGGRFADRFPGIAARCRQAGIDPAWQCIPIRPAAHYHMGGIAVDREGQSSIAGLWACGEAAATGLHGANRLASNSLLEAVVGARFVAESVAAAPEGTSIAPPRVTAPRPHPVPDRIRPILSRAAGIFRHRDPLTQAILQLLPLAQSDEPHSDPAIVALMIAVAALRREESRGAHARDDFPEKLAVPTHQRGLTLAEARGYAEALRSTTIQHVEAA